MHTKIPLRICSKSFDSLICAKQSQTIYAIPLLSMFLNSRKVDLIKIKRFRVVASVQHLCQHRAYFSSSFIHIFSHFLVKITINLYQSNTKITNICILLPFNSSFAQQKKITLINYQYFYQMDQTGNSFGSNPASLKGKLQTLEQQIKNISNQLNNHKKQVQILRSEKDTLESVLTMKTADVKKSLSNELVRIEEEMKRHFNFQKAENSRIQQQITSLKGEKTALQQQLLGLQRRITELEMQVGSEGH